MKDIKGFETFVKIEPLDKGMSGDKKYYIETADGMHLLLRTAGISKYDRKRVLYDMICVVSKLGIPMSKPIDFGICDSGKNVYTLLTWCDGEDTEKALLLLPVTEQYSLGYKAGEFLRIIHSIPAPDSLEDWAIRYGKVIDLRLPSYQKCGVQFNGDSFILDYLKENRYLLKNRPQCFHHGDFHIGNLILGKNNELSIIDWDRADFDNFGDPWVDFHNIGDNVAVSPHFATGQIHGYFGGEPPVNFWPLLAYYLSATAITAVAWSLDFGQEMTDEILALNNNILRWFNNMRNTVPTWYANTSNPKIYSQ